ncbi:potassium channel AKT2/3 isoform X2 [Solenopsis invicta]|uniref:potassium channel AKT2/3 isoform X2 n=1 Tax=Solenopsis invicta TaxID=13686 RepID=UPI00193DC8AD|nr:potassium channel AKT2/3 isoform X2 [Solenopsis invicta]XP_039302591.1 potassium channel AKT2/3 isoform X2 [Solenopsis invicta]
MDDIANSRGREIFSTGSKFRNAALVLPDHSNSVACSNVNMTSIDSGVETGNDSNDSSIVQQDGQQQQQIAVGQVINNDVTAVNTDSSGEFSKLATYDWTSLRLPLPRPWLQDEAKWSSSDVMLLPKRTLFKINTSEMLEMIGIRNTHKTSELLKAHDPYRSKIRGHLRPWRKGTNQVLLSFTDWQTCNMHRRMRLAATTNNVALVKHLLDLGVSPNNHDDHGRTPLHIAACRGYTEIVRLLLEYGADPNQRDCVGNTPLHLGTVNGKLSVVTLLLTAGTDVLAIDSYGYNPLQLAKTKLRLLQQHCNGDLLKAKEEMHNVINMLMAYLQKQKNMQEQVETLSNFCSRLSLSNTTDQVQDDVKDLLENIDALNITD